MNSIITSVYYITNKIESSHRYSRSIMKRSLAEAPFHKDVDWLTTSLEVLRKIIIPIAICYPGFMRLKRLDTGLTTFSF